MTFQRKMLYKKRRGERMYKAMQITVVALLELFSSILIMYGIFQCRFKKKCNYHVISFVSFLLIILIAIYSGKYDTFPPFSFVAEVVFVIISFRGSLIKKTVLYLLKVFHTLRIMFIGIQ